MAKYDVEISATAEKQIKRLRRDDQIRVVRAIAALGDDPRPVGCRKLRGFGDVFRIRVGIYRVLYEIHGRSLIIVVLKVGHRKDVYR